MKKEIFALNRQCSRIEKCLLVGLRAMGDGVQSFAQARQSMALVGIDHQGVAEFANLRLALARHGAAVRFLAPNSSFVCIDEMDLLASLHRLSIADVLDTLLQANSMYATNPVLSALYRCARVLRDSGVVVRQRTLPVAGRRILEQEAKAADIRRAASMARRTVWVDRVAQLTPSLRRITLAGVVLDGYLPDRPAQWLKLFAPMGLGDLGDIGRAYTIRAYRPQAGELDLDVVLHDRGPLSRWAASAWPGQSLRISGACGGYAIAAELPWILLAGDTAALPSIAAIVEAKAPGTVAHVLLDVLDEGDLAALPRSDTVRLVATVRRSRGKATQGGLIELLRGVALPAEHGRVWVGAEAGVTRALRRHLLGKRALAAADVHTVAYWKLGEQDHKDIAAG